MNHRSENQRFDGVSGAVIAGLVAAQSNLVCVMHADMRRSPDLVPRLRDTQRRTRADVVVASRYHRGTSITSRTSSIARLISRRHRGRIPIMGFFLVRKDRLYLDRLHGDGARILIEILVQHPRLRVAEIELHFADRETSTRRVRWGRKGRYLPYLWTLFST